MRKIQAFVVFAIATAAIVLTPLLGEAAPPLFTGTLAITSHRDGISTEIYIITPTSQTNITNDPAEDDDAAWSPDGERIAFKSDRGGDLDIWAMDPDGSNPVNISNFPGGDDHYPTWSPDGSKIAFHSNRDGNDEIYIMNADGTGQTRLTNDPAFDGAARFSPDGQKILFVSSRLSNVDLYTVDTDGTNVTRLTTDPGVDHFPTWSPDGETIAFGSRRGSSYELFTISADGTNEQQLTNDGKQSTAPAYSPDGTQIAFQRDLSDFGDEDSVDQFLMSSSGGEILQLTDTDGLDGDADWKPEAPGGGDTTPPAVTLDALTTPTNDATPAFSGNAGTAPGDVNAVSLKIYSGGSASGTPVQTLPATPAAGAWSATAASLADGTYTAQAEQVDDAANTGLSDPRTFTVDTDLPETSITSGPAEGSTTSSTSASFGFTSDEAESTFTCILDGGTAEACNTGAKSYTGLALGSHTFSVAAADPAGNVDSSPATRTWTIVAGAATPTTLSYTGEQLVTSAGPSATISAKLAGTGCVAGKTISFALDRDPDGIGTATDALGSAITTNKGVASLSVSTNGWNAGVYSVLASFAGSPGCTASGDEATLTIGSLTNVADGGGYTNVSGAGRTNFGFTIRSTGTGFEGEFLMVNPGRWRLAGAVTSYSRSGQIGTASGTGDLYRWDAGTGTWVLSEAGVAFSISFEDSGGKKPDRFGITTINHTVVAGEPSPLPTGARQGLKAGGVTLR